MYFCKRKTNPNIIHEHFIQPQGAQRAFYNVCDRLSSNYYTGSNPRIRPNPSIFKTLGRTILVTNILPRNTIASQESTSTRIPLIHYLVSNGLKERKKGIDAVNNLEIKVDTQRVSIMVRVFGRPFKTFSNNAPLLHRSSANHSLSRFYGRKCYSVSESHIG